uniref:Uncharacterized protein n=1 Tax=Gadus morhua TaxID=8049 RepID=A0A8C5CLL2_GADMO
MSSEKAYRIVLAGDAAVGKSSFLLRLCKNEFRLNGSATLGSLLFFSYGTLQDRRGRAVGLCLSYCLCL